MDINAVKTRVEIIQGLITSIGILAAGTWTFFVFVLGRGFAPNIQVVFCLKKLVCHSTSRTAIITVKIKNIGKIRVKKKNFRIAVVSIKDEYKEIESPQPIRIDSSLDTILSSAKVYSLFDDVSWFEPNEESEEDFLLFLSNSSIIKIYSIFDGYKQSWTSNSIIETSSDVIKNRDI